MNNNDDAYGSIKTYKYVHDIKEFVSKFIFNNGHDRKYLICIKCLQILEKTIFVTASLRLLKESHVTFIEVEA